MVSNSFPRVTIIVPFYNCEKYIAEALDSIINQVYTDFECILINDASADRSDEVVQKYLSDPRLIYIRNTTRVGIVENLNKGVSLARGSLIARMDGDDISDITRLQKQVAFLDENPEINMVGTFAEVIDENGSLTGRKIKKPIDPTEIKQDLIVYLTVIHGTVLLRKEVFVKAGLYRPEYLYCEDVDFTYRAIFGGIKASNVDEYLYKYRYHGLSTAHSARASALRAFRLRRETIKRFSLSLSVKQWFMIAAQLLVGYFLTGRQRQLIERTYKKIMYGDS